MSVVLQQCGVPHRVNAQLFTRAHHYHSKRTAAPATKLRKLRRLRRVDSSRDRIPDRSLHSLSTATIVNYIRER